MTIYTRSYLVEQTTPAAFALSDTRSIVSTIAREFLDLDLDFTDLGGNISWVEPLDTQEARDASRAQVTEYFVYLGDSPEPGKFLGQNGSSPWSGRSLLGSAPVGTNDIFVTSETPRNGYGYATWIRKQTTPAVHVIHDADASVSNVGFVGKDLDLEDLGGYVSWTQPASDADRVLAYSVYLSEDDMGTGRSKIEQDVPLGTDQLLVPADTPRGIFTRFVVYTRSILVEQTTPTAHLLFDTSALPRNLDFLDQDVDRGDLGGNLTWQVTEYVVYLSENAYGKDRLMLANVSWDTYEPLGFILPPTSALPFLRPEDKSSLAEMTTPAALLILDSVAEVDNITLFDRDWIKFGVSKISIACQVKTLVAGSK
ncbi:unnamed protein product [Effrenium voratum]|uniref:Uncharacterized protein n=1 Tax=Effrenium voratum TaxID=2562239 RepID=A0AA36IJS9_9DINO|nr:unnamed protein product [Effrenium voratum]